MQYVKQGMMAFCGLVLLISGTAVWAQGDDGHRIHFAVQERMTLDNDRVTVTFAAQSQQTNATLVTQDINRQMQLAMSALKGYSQVKKQTQQYSIHPVYGKEQKIRHWRGQQTLALTMDNTDQVAEILNRVQQLLTYKSMSFFVSQSRQDATLKTLTDKAIQSYQDKAKSIAQGFGHQTYRLIQTNINTPHARAPQSLVRHEAVAMMRADSVAPVIEGGQSTLTISISGEMLL